MPLNRIEVCDFKSYRGHQVIGPFKNFTSVIGPNGAGKSNLMDAISFVLGIKSAQLRSSQMKDLVYRGRRLAKDDKETAETNMEEDEEGEGEGTAKKAWVIAVYTDPDGKEYKFQRTVSTAGSSEYKINNKVVTYQSYNATLEKQNILVKAKNFLVFQGDVEAVASQSPKDLARLIEQISGSLELAGEYDAAKAAQDRATENATFNFTKRRGIAGEIKQFKEQKSEAQRFEKIKSERDQLIVQKLLWKLYRVEETIQSNMQEINEKNKQLHGLRAQQETHDKHLATARKEQADARNETLKKDKAIKKQEKALEKKRPDFVAIEAQIAHSKRKADNAHKLGETVRRDVEKKEEELARLAKDLEDLRKAANAASEVQRKASQAGLALTEDSLAKYRQLRARANVLAVEERQQLESLTREEKTQARSLTALKDRHSEFLEKKTKLKADDEVMSAKKADLEAKVTSLQGDLATVKKELTNAQSERKRLSQLETEANEKLLDVQNKLLQANADQRESEREVKLKETFASLQRLFPGVRGRVVDLCKPTQRKYETAVSIILGRNIDAIVVDQERTAIDCIEYLRNQRAGQATFIPLDTIQVKPINDKFRTFAKGARLAVDVIEFEPAVERAMHHACGNALVCDTIEVAKYVCYEKGQEVKAVTLDGTVMHKSGLITGGRGSQSNSRKWDAGEVQALRRVNDELHAQLRDILKKKPQGKVDEGLIAEISRLESALVLARDDLNSAKLKFTGIKDELKHIEKELKKLNPELEKSQSAHDRLQTRVDELRSTVDTAEAAIFASFCTEIGVPNIRAYEERQLKAAQAETDARMRYDTNIARQSHQLDFDKRQLADTRARLDKLEQTAKAEHAALATLEESRTTAQAALEDLQEGVTELTSELEALNEVLEEKTKALEGVKKSTLKAGKKLDTVLKEITLMNDEITKLGSDRAGVYRKCRLEEIQLPLLAGSLDQVPMEENLREDVAMNIDQDEDATQQPLQTEDFGIEVDFEDLEEDDRSDPDAGARFDAEIVKLTNDIDKMAPNMKAMEKLDDVETKLAYTEKEADKARKDSKAARDAFNDVKKRRCDLFNKAYAHISERIDQVYKDLTKGKASTIGGVAYLGLEDSEEPYTAGVKYHAMPPMKRFRDMELLSGGEKTVAALALLFAIHSYQPSPFFVLDEVDAALDNTNVSKIANYIRQQASDTFQFIVISLKGNLYEHGHSLVGIYRDQEVNSSRTLTLDLTQFDDRL